MSDEYKREIEQEIERISHISDKFKQQEEFAKFFCSNFWKYVADEVQASYDNLLVVHQI